MIPRKYFKTQLAYDRQAYWCPEIALVAAESIEYAKTIGVDCPIITESVTTLAEDQALKRVSSTHREGRAFDLRTIDWSGEQIDAMVSHLTATFPELGALSPEGIRTIALYHDSGYGPHFHVQVDRKFQQKEFKG